MAGRLAAIEGQGVAIAQKFLVEDNLRRRRLVQPFAMNLRSRRFHLLPDLPEEPAAQSFFQDFPAMANRADA
jgi:DNA-binding transcriptional LysR family regulator